MRLFLIIPFLGAVLCAQDPGGSQHEVFLAEALGTEAGDAELTRFNGVKRECGLHGLEG